MVGLIRDQAMLKEWYLVGKADVTGEMEWRGDLESM